MEAIQHVGPAGKCLAAWTERYKGHASPLDSVNSDRYWRPSVAGESFHPHGRQYQVDLECRGRHWRRVVAPRRIWIIPLPLAYPRRVTSTQTRNIPKGSTGLTVTRYE